MTWKHIVLGALGSGLLVAAALIPPAATILVGAGMTLIGGAVGHASNPVNKSP